MRTYINMAEIHKHNIEQNKTKYKKEYILYDSTYMKVKPVSQESIHWRMVEGPVVTWVYLICEN